MKDLNKVAQPVSFKDHAYEEIKAAIINHVFPGGTILSERDLSAKLGISRTPLRAALQQLELQGWVETMPRKGIKVVPIVRQDVIEVMQVRKANELLSLELLMPIIQEEQIQRLINQFAPSCQLSQEKLFDLTVGDDLHVCLAELCHNRRLVQILKSLSEQMRWFGFWAMQVPGRMAEVLQEHDGILRAIEQGDLGLAKARVTEHLEKSCQAILAGLPCENEKM